MAEKISEDNKPTFSAEQPSARPASRRWHGRTQPRRREERDGLQRSGKVEQERRQTRDRRKTD